jgi:hypothetical protein
MVVASFNGDGNADIASLIQFEPGVALIPVFSAAASITFVFCGNGDGRFSSPVVAGVFDRIYTGIYTAGTATLTITTTAATSSAAVNTRSREWPWYAGSDATLACILLVGIPAGRRGWRGLECFCSWRQQRAMCSHAVAVATVVLAEVVEGRGGQATKAPERKLILSR